MSKRKQSTLPKKGKEIRFIRGVYVGLTGWTNDAVNTPAKKRTSKMRGVIVSMPGGQDKPANVWRRSYPKQFKDTTNRAEAAIQQHPKIEMAMIDLCEMVAQCELRTHQDIIHIMNAELTEAKKHQRDMKGKARYRRVEYDEENHGMPLAI